MKINLPLSRFFYALIFLMLFSSCGKDDDAQPVVEQGPVCLPVKITRVKTCNMPSVDTLVYNSKNLLSEIIKIANNGDTSYINFSYDSQNRLNERVERRKSSQYKSEYFYTNNKPTEVKYFNITNGTSFSGKSLLKYDQNGKVNDIENYDKNNNLISDLIDVTYDSEGQIIVLETFDPPTSRAFKVKVSYDDKKYVFARYNDALSVLFEVYSELNKVHPVLHNVLSFEHAVKEDSTYKVYYKIDNSFTYNNKGYPIEMISEIDDVSANTKSTETTYFEYNCF
ncbi:MAG: hypothetical protein LPJ89_09885 [Hymenobacteraceae bacterium]|nr:hypothetical protein [Hymenobacteraceae bacterium]MDX5395543.1 hypothetical protein [Hymenobacteraceae bacterium]MDX5444077.1 hypothetical protein [Hymenobacteraceae bacterium]MDX5511597.1 hypothetical protein [Hymenobacteraceae bacterium]